MKKHTIDSEKMNCLFVILSPYQYYNALEFIHQKNISNSNIIFFIYVNNPEIIIEIDKSLNLNFKKEIHFFDDSHLPSPSDIKTRKEVFHEINRMIKRYQINFLVLGNFLADVCYAIAQKYKNKINPIWLLDDGITSIKILNSRNKQNDYKTHHVRSLKNIIKNELKFNMFLPFRSPFKELSFFSIYHEKPGKNDVVLINKSSLLKKNISQKLIDKNKVFFIGSIYIKKKSVEPIVYFDLLTNVVEKLKKEGKNVIYIPHRGEEERDLEVIQNILPIQRNLLTFELMLGTLDELPVEILGFYTSVFFTISNLLPESIQLKSIRLGVPFINQKEGDGEEYIKSVYDSLGKSNRIEVVEYMNYIEAKR